MFIYVSSQAKGSFTKADINEIKSRIDSFVHVTVVGKPEKSEKPEHSISFDTFHSISEFLRCRCLHLYFIDLAKNLYNLRYMQKWRHHLVSFLRAHYISRKLREPEYSGSVFYTFWLNEIALALALLKRREPQVNVYARAHSRDLYNERDPLGTISCQWIMLKYLDAIYPVSIHGADYLRSKYPKQRKKIHTVYLGSIAPGIRNFRPNPGYLIVTCATIRNVKRLHLLPEILKHVKCELKWVHFGGEGSQKKDSTIQLFHERILKLPSNIQFENKGKVDHEQILNFYKAQFPNLFINLSEFEGIPVSIMEAISCGIPVLATDVGGVSEIINDRTGILIDLNFDAYQVAQKIEQFKHSQMNSAGFRKDVHLFWKRTFNMKANYDQFVKQISG